MPVKTKRSARKQQEQRSRFDNIRSLKQLKEKRLDALHAMERMRRSIRSSENGRFTPEERQQWERATRDYNNLSRLIAVETKFRQAKRETESLEEDRLTRDHSGFREKRREDRGERQPKITNEIRNQALQAWFMTRSGREDRLTREHRQACKLVGLNRRCDELSINMYRAPDVLKMQRFYKRFHPSVAGEHAERSNFSSNSPVDGGVLTMPTIVNTMEQAMLDYSGIMQAADIIVTDHGNTMSWPTANDTGNKGRRIGAGKTAAAGATGIFKKFTWGAHKYTSDGLAIEQEEIEDAGFDLTNYIPSIGAERIARIFNDEATTGGGENMPEGINNCYVGYTTAASGTCTPTDIIKFLGKLESSYRPGAQIMMNDTIMTEIAVMVDGQGNFIWKAGLEFGQPDRLRGVPIIPNVSMDSTIEANKKIMLYGQMKSIKVRRVRAMRIYRERDNATDRELFYIYVRMDSKVLDAGTHPLILMKVKP